MGLLMKSVTFILPNLSPQKESLLLEFDQCFSLINQLFFLYEFSIFITPPGF